jgi:carotenoid cleavage dioxygenase
VVVDVVRHPKMFATDLLGPYEGDPSLERWTLDPVAGSSRREVLSDRAQEFPRHDERLVGRRHRYGYDVTFDGPAPGGAPIFGALLKHDLDRVTTEVHDFGPDEMAMEPVFVPVDAGAAEDDGWILVYVHDAKRDGCDVHILHAQDFAGRPGATIHLPVRVPFGFHGNWVPVRS